ncbi:MAG: hypothetical protein HZC06_09100 [Methylocystis sp.]|nr:hypothetical protein [Methylocystis sp.]
MKTIAIAADADIHGVGFAGGSRWLLIINTGGNSLSIIDAEIDQVVKTISVPKAPEGIAVNG